MNGRKWGTLPQQNLRVEGYNNQSNGDLSALFLKISKNYDKQCTEMIIIEITLVTVLKVILKPEAKGIISNDDPVCI